MMGTTIRIIWAITWRTLLFIVVVGTGLWWMNRDDRWDANAVINSTSNRVEGRAGLIVVGLAQPERFEPKFFVNFLEKLLGEAIPWPINVIAGADRGVVLMDPGHAFATARFEPEALADIWGNKKDIDGVDWIEKYRRGETRWEKPSATVPHDTGFFLYPARKQGMRTVAAKTSAKARYIYYASLPGGILPHYRQTIDMAERGIEIAKARNPIIAADFADAFDPSQKEQAVRRVLDSGIDTLILASVQPIHSDFEELRGSFSGVHKIVEAWRKEHGGKRINIAIAPYLASQPSFDQLWLDHFERTVPPATKTGQSAMGIITQHGLPVAMIAKDSWSGRVKSVTDRLKPKMAAILKRKGYGDVRVETGPEGFGDMLEDPDNVVTSVSEFFAIGRAQKRTIAIALPIEFLSENTDTLFAHAALMFDGLPGYKTYQGPAADTDWSKPYVRQFRQGQTMQIYAGSPGGDYQELASAALATSIGSLFKK